MDSPTANHAEFIAHEKRRNINEDLKNFHEASMSRELLSTQQKQRTTLTPGASRMLHEVTLTLVPNICPHGWFRGPVHPGCLNVMLHTCVIFKDETEDEKQ